MNKWCQGPHKSASTLVQMHTPSKEGSTAYQRLPARLSSISVSVGADVLDLSNEYIDMTKPGVQKPHWEPCALASRA